MRETTMDDRRHELASLLDAIARHPEREWSNERQRIAVLREMLAGHDRPRTATD
jgi:hypothetical protein